jgi:cytochrome bd-type quinol oxidase subunit 2
MQHSSVSLLTALIFTVVVFLLGAAWAAMRRANKDYKTLKNAVKPARKTFWSAFFAMVKVGVGVAVLLLVVVAWQVRDINDGDADTPLIPAQVKPSATPNAR